MRCFIVADVIGGGGGRAWGEQYFHLLLIKCTSLATHIYYLNTFAILGVICI